MTPNTSYNSDLLLTTKNADIHINVTSIIFIIFRGVTYINL